jgi:hypothetical protein
MAAAYLRCYFVEPNYKGDLGWSSPQLLQPLAYKEKHGSGTKKFMKAKHNKGKKNKRDTRSSSDKTIRSPLRQQKRKRSKATSVLTGVRKKKAKTNTSSEDSADSDSTSDGSNTSPPLVAVGNRRVLPQRSSPHVSEKQKTNIITVLDADGDSSTNTSDTNNNSTLIVELLRKEKVRLVQSLPVQLRNLIKALKRNQHQYQKILWQKRVTILVQ